MTAVDPALSGAADTDPAGRKKSTWWDRLEQWIEKAGERLNPILVKEARQALKSKQFSITFALLLICGWGWSLIGVTFSSAPHYVASGPEMLIGYFWVLAFPLIVIVPFSAFRSLAAEREDGTYELLSITTLTARQIVGGKLGSAVLQMMVYLSALSPCIAFTYLLRGVDIVTIGLFLLYLFLASLLLSVVGLLLATLTRARHWQSVLSVLLIIGLFLVYIYSVAGVTSMLIWQPSLPVDEPYFWIGQATFWTTYASYFVLFFVAAAARINFASENRSTALRIVMLAQQTLLVGWIMWYWLAEREDEVWFVLLTLGAIHWAVMGALMTGESAQLSQRVRRSLPQSLLARMLLTGLNPGPGSGYLLAVTNMLSLVLLTVLAISVGRISGFTGAPNNSRAIWFGILAFCYLVSYLGAGRLLIMLIRRVATCTLSAALLIQLLLVMAGTAAPLLFQYSLVEFYDYDYSVLQLTNPFWTLAVTADGDIFSHTVQLLALNVPLVPLLLVASASVLLPLNLIATADEVRLQREETPVRVLEDEVQLHPEKATPPPPRTNPWDDVLGDVS